MTTAEPGRRLLPAYLLVGAALALTGCGDGLAPEESGSFDLVQVDGSSPPRVVATERDTTVGTDTTRTLAVVDGSVSISSDGSATVSINGRETVESGGSTDSNTNSAAVTGTVEGGDLVLDADSIDVETYPFSVTGADAGSSVITVGLSRTRTPFDVSVELRFEKQ